MGFKYDVYLSYSSFDNSIALPIKNSLIENGVSVFNLDSTENKSFVRDSAPKAIMNSEYFVFICSSEFLRHYRSTMFDVSEKYISHIDAEIRDALDCAVHNGLKIIPVILTRRFGYENISSVIKEIFGRDLSAIIGTSLSTVKTKLINEIKRLQRIKELFSKAERELTYGAYEQASNSYLLLVDLVEEEAKSNCYNRAAICCEKAGLFDKAKELYILSSNDEAIKRLENDVNPIETTDSTKSVDRELLNKIAAYCDASIDLFYELLKKNQSPEGLNCLKTSYSRLLNYCKTIGGMDDLISSALLKIKTVETDFSKNKISTDINNANFIKSYRTYLGLEFPASENYDVFISYKSEDEVFARRVYDYLLSQGKRVFFSCEVLPDMGKTEYREAIMDALDHSQHFVLVTSKLDYITSNWVKEEWSFYVSKLIEEDHKGNIAIVIHDDFKVNKNDLPPNLRFRQRFLMSNFKESLLKYLQQ